MFTRVHSQITPCYPPTQVPCNRFAFKVPQTLYEIAGAREGQVHEDDWLRRRCIDDDMKMEHAANVK